MMVSFTKCIQRKDNYVLVRSQNHARPNPMTFQPSLSLQSAFSFSFPCTFSSSPLSLPSSPDSSSFSVPRSSVFLCPPLSVPSELLPSVTDRSSSSASRRDGICMIRVRLPRHTPISSNIDVLVLDNGPSRKTDCSSPQRIT